MRKLLLLISFVLLCLYSFTQTNIQQDNRVNPILKWAVDPQSGYKTYGRTGRFINIATLNQLSHTISWFTCHGRLFDSTKLNDQEFEQVISKQLDPFGLYQNICDKYLADIAAAKDLYRVYGENHLFDRLNGNYRALFAMESVQAAKTPLQKLVTIENVRKKILTQLAWLNCANPASLHDDPLYRVNKEQAGVMMQTKDSTVYYNIDPTSAVAKISLYKRSPEKLYVQNRLGEVIDSVSLLPAKSALLQQEKTDVFLLYRGWLEMQWQEAVGLTRITPAEYQLVNVREESYRQLNAIRAMINLLISPEAKCIEQAVYETYRSETSEIYYIPLLGIGYNLVQTRGLKEYELSNHLGNVLVTISDRKNGVPSSSNSSLIDHYEPDIVSAQDYYPFGMLQPGRSMNVSGYRYGFNGKENDNEVKGSGNQYDYGFRIYDPRISRFLSVDPLAQSYPWYTPYQFAGNMPIAFIDLDGLEEVRPIVHYDPNCQCGNASYPTLKPSQWYVKDRSSASGTFATAAEFNTRNLNNSVYEPVDQIHRYYVWAGREIDKQKSNIKFFHAARDVTSFWGVGGAFDGPEWYTGLSDHARKSLADVNSKLLKENMPVIREILETGKSSLFNGKKGILWDFEYVNREQTFLTEVINKDPLTEAEKNVINNNFKRFEKNMVFPDHPEYTLAKSLLGVKNLDYLPQRQRMAIGRSLVFLIHLERKGFEGSSEYVNGLNFLRKEYGGAGVAKFLETLKDMNKIKKD